MSKCANGPYRLKVCPICNREPATGDRLVLEYLPEQEWWIMVHLKPITEPGNWNQTEHKGYPGFYMYCGHARNMQPGEVKNGGAL